MDVDGDIGVNLRHSHGTVDATGTITIPIFKEAQFRKESRGLHYNTDYPLKSPLVQNIVL